ncbi:uncharacterized protein TNCV_2512271 [Trichonephila clavipes]|nr:uncharacterized protein TNCV_2512271 [Trichonephila clavipes]
MPIEGLDNHKKYLVSQRPDDNFKVSVDSVTTLARDLGIDPEVPSRSSRKGGGTLGLCTKAAYILGLALNKDVDENLNQKIGLIQGRALDWFDVLSYRVVEEKATDYARLKQALTEQFPVARNRPELETRFYASYQNHNQRPSNFVYELLKIHKQLKLEMGEETLLDHNISRLEPQLLDYVEVRHPQTTSNLLQIIDKNRQENWRDTRVNNRYFDNSRPPRESNRFEGQGVGDNRRFYSRRRSGQSDHRFNNQGGRQGGSRNGAFRGQNGQDRMIKWAFKLSEFNIEWEHRPGAQNVVADVLSRNLVDKVDGSQISCAALRALALNSREQIIQVQREDPELGHMYHYYENPDDASVNATVCEGWFQDFKLIDGLLIYAKYCTTLGELRVYIPQSFREAIMHQFHDQPLAGHLGKRKTYLTLNVTCYFPYMRSYTLCRKKIYAPRRNQATITKLGKNVVW